MIDLQFRLEQGDFVLEVHERLNGRVTALFGPSGAGKTTVLDVRCSVRHRPSTYRRTGVTSATFRRTSPFFRI